MKVVALCECVSGTRWPKHFVSIATRWEEINWEYSDDEVDEEVSESESSIPSDEENSDLTTTPKLGM